MTGEVTVFDSEKLRPLETSPLPATGRIPTAPRPFGLPLLESTTTTGRHGVAM